MATIDSQGSTYLWNVATQRLTAALLDPQIHSFKGDVVSPSYDNAVFSPDGTTLATTDSQGSTYLWNVATRRLTAAFPDPHSYGVERAVFSPRGTTLATADSNGSTYLWNVRRAVKSNQ